MRRLSMPKLMKPSSNGLSPDEMEVLMDFHSSRNKTLGQLMSSNSLAGSKIAECIEKLRDFGLIRRDWEKEIEMGVDVVYSITEFGIEQARKYANRGVTS